MTQDAFVILGGVGMFLLGMELMTNALRQAAGSNLRRLLSRFTTTPLRGVLTGAAATAMIQSSSATTVMTVGFVGAGLLTLQQALGILYGANIGTTATGWLVSVLGLKLDLARIALLLLLPASLTVLLAHGSAAVAGRILAGLCLLLIGLEMMQTGIGEVTSLISPNRLPGDTVAGLLGLVAIGLVVTVVIQSSSAAIALALVMLQSGAISLTQGAAIVIGMNIGTTFTALLASIGGSRPMRQTAVANIVFNLATAGFAFLVVVLASGALARLGQIAGPLTALLLFHSGFNIAGAILFLPLTDLFAKAVTQLVPDRNVDALPLLDRKMLTDTGSALVAARAAATRIARRQFSALAAALQDPPDYRGLSALAPTIERAVDDLELYLADIRLPAEISPDTESYAALMHQADHLRRLHGRSQQKARIQVLFDDDVLRRPALAFGAVLGRAARPDAPDLEPDRLGRLLNLVDHRTDRHRRGLLMGETTGPHSVRDVFEHTDTMRWLKRAMHHAERIGHYDLLTRSALDARSASPE